MRNLKEVHYYMCPRTQVLTYHKCRGKSLLGSTKGWHLHSSPRHTPHHLLCSPAGVSSNTTHRYYFPITPVGSFNNLSNCGHGTQHAIYTYITMAASLCQPCHSHLPFASASRNTARWLTPSLARLPTSNHSLTSHYPGWSTSHLIVYVTITFPWQFLEI